MNFFIYILLSSYISFTILSHRRVTDIIDILEIIVISEQPAVEGKADESLSDPVSKIVFCSFSNCRQ